MESTKFRNPNLKQLKKCIYLVSVKNTLQGGYISVCLFVFYLAARHRVVTPMLCLTPLTGLPLGVGRADALSGLRVAVSSSLGTVACWEIIKKK